MSGSNSVDNTINGTVISKEGDGECDRASYIRRRWCFVLNNPETHPNINWENQCIRCWCYQYEIGAGTKKNPEGTPHYQGYFELKRPQRLSWIKNNMSKEMHLDFCFGTRIENIHYCSKPHGPDDNCFDKCESICYCKHCKDARKCPPKIKDIEFGGDWERDEGKRTDLKDFEIAVKADMSVKELWENYFAFMLRYRTMIITMRLDMNKVYFVGIREVTLIFGDSGTGKSESVRQKDPEVYDKSLTKKDMDWWEDYEGQEAVHFEDFTGEIPMREMLRLCDRYKYGVPRRYIGVIPFDGRRIYITSNSLVEKWYEKEDNIERFNAFYRRIKHYVVTKRGIKDHFTTDCLYEFQALVKEHHPDHEFYIKANVCFCNTCQNKE